MFRRQEGKNIIETFFDWDLWCKAQDQLNRDVRIEKFGYDEELEGKIEAKWGKGGIVEKVGRVLAAAVAGAAR